MIDIIPKQWIGRVRARFKGQSSFSRPTRAWAAGVHHRRHLAIGGVSPVQLSGSWPVL